MRPKLLTTILCGLALALPCTMHLFAQDCTSPAERAAKITAAHTEPTFVNSGEEADYAAYDSELNPSDDANWGVPPAIDPAVIAMASPTPAAPAGAACENCTTSPAACDAIVQHSLIVHSDGRTTLVVGQPIRNAGRLLGRVTGIGNGNRARYLDGSGWRPGKVIGTFLHNVGARMHARQSNGAARRAARGC